MSILTTAISLSDRIEKLLQTKLLQTPKHTITRVALIRQLSALEQFEAHLRDGSNGQEAYALAEKYGKIASKLLEV